MSDEEGFSARRRRRRMVKEESEESTSSRNGFGSRQSSLDGETMQEGRTLIALSEAKRKKIQQQLLEGMLKYAEQKYGRKKPQSSMVEEKRSPMEDYELYLRSLNIKVKSSSDKLAIFTKQKRDIEAKLAEAEKEHNFHKSKFTKAEEEKQNAINENRDPVLPRDFIPPQKVKSRGKAANLGALVMKASSQMEIWEDKFNAKRTKKNANTPEWIAKQKKSDKTSALLNAGRNKMKEKKTEPKVPLSTLNKVNGNRTKPESKIEEQTNSKPQEPVKAEPTVSSEESEEEESEEERPTFRRRRNRIPRSDDEDFDI